MGTRSALPLSVVLLFAGIAGAGGAAEPTGPEVAVAEYAAAHGFSGTVLVQGRGGILYHRSFGLADRALEVPATNDTVYRIASITKLFTATLVLKLLEERRIDLRAPIRTYLPAYAGEGGDRVTVHHLLDHTSGLPNVDTIRS